MKRLSGICAFILLASPLFAQDVDFGAFNDEPAPLAPVAPAARGAAPTRGLPPAPPPPDRLVRLRDALAKAEAPLTKDQEAALNALVTAEIPVMRQTLQTHGQQMMAARPPASPPSTPFGAPPAGPAAGGAAATPPAASPGPPPAASSPFGAVPPTAAGARGALPVGGAVSNTPASQATPPAASSPFGAAPSPAAGARGALPVGGAVSNTAASQGTPPAASSPFGAVPPPAAGARGALPVGGAPTPALLAAALAARGAGPAARVPAEVLDALEVEMRQMNDGLFLKIASAPALDAKQQSVLKKMSRDQIKARGGYDALRISMEDAGAPFSEEQAPKVQGLFEDQKKARSELARESQGTPDAARLKQLERDTLTKVVSLLTPTQRAALLAMLRTQQ